MYCYFCVGKGTPQQLIAFNHGITQNICPPSLAVAVSDYEHDGGTLTYDSKFGHDPLWTLPHLFTRRNLLVRSYLPTFEDIFTAVVSDTNDHVLERSIDKFKETTLRLLDLA